MLTDILSLCVGLAVSVSPNENTCLRLNLRTRVETFKGSDVWDEVIIPKEFPVAETAILICDMWDKHWCEGATKRVDAMAPIMNSVVQQRGKTASR